MKIMDSQSHQNTYQKAYIFPHALKGALKGGSRLAYLVGVNLFKQMTRQTMRCTAECAKKRELNKTCVIECQKMNCQKQKERLKTMQNLVKNHHLSTPPKASSPKQSTSFKKPS